MTSKYVDDNDAQHWERFSDIETKPYRKLMPIQGYADKPLVPLEEAVEPLVLLVHDIKRMAACAKWKCEDPLPDNLTLDQSAAIKLYSMQWIPKEKCLFVVLNSTLRNEDRDQLIPWFLYLKLLLTALAHLPSSPKVVYRGIKLDLREDYKEGKTITWWSFSSCTRTMGVLQNKQFLGSTGARTLFTIECTSGKDIRQHSVFPHEDEVLLPAARQFQVTSSLTQGEDLYIVQLKETKAPFSLIDLVPETVEATITTKREPTLAPSIPIQNMSALTIKTDSKVRWAQNGVTIVGIGKGSALNELYYPQGLYIHNDETIYIADFWNHRIVELRKGTATGKVVAGGNGQGNTMNQLDRPTDVIIDKETNSFIICDYKNGRVMRWSREEGTKSGEILIDNIRCWGLTMDDQRNLYVTDREKHEVRRYQMGNNTGTIVAGGNGQGNRLDQLFEPYFVFVDREYSVYVSDTYNHRVIKWKKGANEGIVVAGGRGRGSSLTQVSYPEGLFVDDSGRVYVAEGGDRFNRGNNRVTRWYEGVATLIVGGNGMGASGNQFNVPTGLSFDRHGNLYVADCWNHRVQRFTIEHS